MSGDVPGKPVGPDRARPLRTDAPSPSSAEAWESLSLTFDMSSFTIDEPAVTLRPDPGKESARAAEAIRALAELMPRGAGPAPEALVLGDTIGEGGMGLVRVARQRSLGRDVAVKTLRPGSGDAARAADMLREAWVAARLEHPNVVPIYDVRLDGDRRPHIVMRRVQGTAWADLIAAPDRVAELAGPTDVLEWHLRVLIQVCRALEYAHGQGILHRDVKPENVLVGRFGEVYLIDWGVAASLWDDGSGQLPLLSASTAVVGTPAYMAPEMLACDNEVTGPATDVYLLGATLYEVVSGEPPHRGTTAQELVFELFQSEPPTPENAPPGLVAVIHRAMKRYTQDRFPDVVSFRRALEAWLQRRTSQRIVEQAGERLAALRETLASDLDPEERRAVMYRDLGACRLGFSHALTVWPDNAEAIAGLREAVLLVARAELDAGARRPAEALLSEIEAPPDDIVAALEALRLTEEADQRRLVVLEALADDLSRSRGALRRRRLLLGLLAVLGVAGPLCEMAVVGLTDLTSSHQTNIVRQLAFTLLAVLGARPALRRMGNSKLNRDVLGYAKGLLASTAAAAMVAPLLGLGPLAAQGMILTSMGTSLLLSSPVLGWSVAPVALVAFTGAAVIGLAPEWTYPVIAGSNLAVVASFWQVLTREMAQGPAVQGPGLASDGGVGASDETVPPRGGPAA